MSSQKEKVSFFNHVLKEMARLSKALETLTQYYHQNSLNANPTKTQVCAFHLNNHEANYKLDIKWNGEKLKNDSFPVYLGVTLDRTLSFAEHVRKVKAKVATRNNLLSKLANSNWGANPQTLRTTALALSYSTAEYCSPVWTNSCHASKIDPELNNACRIITGTLRPTHLPALYRLTGIAPPHIRRSTKAVLTRSIISLTRPPVLHRPLASITLGPISLVCLICSSKPGRF